MDGIKFKNFDYSENGMTIHVEWWAKDFVATYHTELSDLKTGLHMMYMIPKAYSEEMIRTEYCSDVCEALKDAYNLLKENPDFVKNFPEEYVNHFKEQDDELAKWQEERRTKRNLFKAGELSEKEWTSFCKKYNDVKWSLRMEKDEYHRQYACRLSKGKYPLTNILRDYLESQLAKNL